MTNSRLLIRSSFWISTKSVVSHVQPFFIISQTRWKKRQTHYVAESMRTPARRTCFFAELLPRGMSLYAVVLQVPFTGTQRLFRDDDAPWRHGVWRSEEGRRTRVSCNPGPIEHRWDELDLPRRRTGTKSGTGSSTSTGGCSVHSSVKLLDVQRTTRHEFPDRTETESALLLHNALLIRTTTRTANRRCSENTHKNAESWIFLLLFSFFFLFFFFKSRNLCPVKLDLGEREPLWFLCPRYKRTREVTRVSFSAVHEVSHPVVWLCMKICRERKTR